MAYPNVIYGLYGDEKRTQSTKIGGLPLGQLMMLPDGRKFRHAQCGSATALKAGAIAACSGTLAGHGGVASSGLLASATTTYNQVGNTTVHIITTSVVATLNQYADGYLHVQGPAGSSYIGHMYRIESNAAAAVSSDLVITLHPRDPLKVAFKAGSTTCSLRKSAYKEAIVYNTGTVIAPPMGVVPVAVSTTDGDHAPHYFWVQRSGEASVIQGATVAVVGGRVTCASAQAGSVTVITTADTTTVVAAYNKATELGYALEAAAASQAILCQLTLE